VLHGKNLQPFTGAVFVICSQLLATPQENPLTYGASVSASFNLRYPGQYFDKESGLSYNYFRSYDSRTGRYSQSDPIGLAGGWNRFAYAESNPLTNSDPLGLFPDSVTAACRTNPILCAEINGPKPIPVPIPIVPTQKSDLEACEKEASDALDRAYDYCKALGATYNDYRTRKACEERAFSKYTQELKKCKEKCK
jgi:RHS repeat-associated protein